MDISLKNLQKRIPLNPLRIPKVVEKILRHEKVKEADLSFVFVTDRRIQALNQKYLKRNHPTDVLAFDLKRITLKSRAAKNLVGEVVISTDTVLRSAKTFKTQSERELILCVIHGILHLLGFDDHRVADTKRMRQKEKELLELVYR